MEFIGILGAFLLIVAWLPPTINSIRNHKSDMNLWFEILFFVGAGLLTVYAINEKDYIFVVLNAIAVVFAFINLQYIPNKIETIEHEIEEISGRKGKTYYHIKHKRKKK